VFFVDVGVPEVMLSRNGGEQCGGYVEFQRATASLQPNTWHTLKAELDGSDLRLNIDGQPLATARDDRLTHGSYYLTVGHGATVQFAELAVTAIP
jgi:hypothetical protein